MKRQSAPIKRRSAPRKTNSKRKAANFKRAYHSKERAEFVKTLPCAACHVIGASDNAHILGNGGMGRKGDAETIAPLCHTRYWSENGKIGHVLGCHPLFDEYRSEFNRRFPDFNPEKAAADTEKLWLSASQPTGEQK